MNIKAQLKNHKVITVSMLILLTILSISLVFGLKTSMNTYTTFNNSESTETLAFTGHQNITRYLDIHENQSVIVGNITLQGTEYIDPDSSFVYTGDVIFNGTMGSGNAYWEFSTVGNDINNLDYYYAWTGAPAYGSIRLYNSMGCA